MRSYVPYIVGKFGDGNYALLQKWIDYDFGKIVKQMSRSIKRLLIVTAKLDGFSLVNY